MPAPEYSDPNFPSRRLFQAGLSEANSDALYVFYEAWSSYYQTALRRITASASDRDLAELDGSPGDVLDGFYATTPTVPVLPGGGGPPSNNPYPQYALDTEVTSALAGYVSASALPAAVAAAVTGKADVAAVLPRTAQVLNAQFMPGVTSTPVVANGVADDTAAMQAFTTAVVTGGLAGFIPAGTIKLTDQLNVPKRSGWTIRGAGRGVTRLLQATDNKPIWYLGSDNASQMHSWEISDMSFDYVNNQPVTNTSAIPILFNGTNNAFAMFLGVLDRLTFARGYYGIGVTAGTWCPWGMHYDNLWFQGGINGLTGGAITMAGGLGGIPQNRYGKLYVTAQNMAGPIFSLRGYNSTIDTIEVNAANQGAQIMLFAAGAEFTVGAIKLENGAYTASTSLIELQTNASVKIGQVFVGGDLSMTVNIPASGALYALRCGTGAYLEVDRVRVQLTALTAGQACIAHPAAGKMLIHNVSKDANWTMVNAAATDDADRIQVGDWLNNFLSPNKGDADYTVVLGDPNIITYSTALTATRTVTLPSDGNNLHNGLYYSVVTAGSASPTNPLVIKAGATTLATVVADGVVRFTWRRVAGTNGAAGWFRTSSAAGSAPDVQVFTANGTWTKPAGAVSVTVQGVGSGGGGASGRRGAAASVRAGGGAGGSGAWSSAKFPASALTGTVAVVAATGPAGGAAVAADDTNGNAGTNGSTSSFGGYWRAAGGLAGSGGTNAAGTGGGAGNGLAPGGGGGAASTTGGAGTAGSAVVGPGPGGAGGGITSADVASAGGNGGTSFMASVTAAAGGTAGGGAGNAGSSPGANVAMPGNGGSGGGGSITGAAGAGGAGGNYGGGGGGGGASLNGNASGAGGSGGAGIVIVVTDF